MYKIILNKFRIINNLWLSSYPLSLLNESSDIVRYKWDRQKNKLRMSFAFISTLLIYIGAELSSPHYSFTTHLYEDILSESSIIAYLNTLDIIHIKGSTLKILIFIAISFFVYFNFLFNDPLSDTELLRKIIIPRSTDQKKIRFIHRLMSNEIHFYAEYCPSNLLPKRCEECRTHGCANRLSITDKKKSSRWNTIFANLPNKNICDLSIHTHRCRLIFYIQYSTWISIIVLILTYAVVRFFEYKDNLEINYYNSSLLNYISIIILIGICIRFFHSTNVTGSRGVWGHFKENVERIFEEQDFKEAFDQYVCKHNKKEFCYTEQNSPRNPPTVFPHEKISGSEIQALLTSIKCLDKGIKLKLLTILEKNSYLKNDKDHLRNTLTALIEMLITLNQSNHRFRGVLLTKTENSDDYLSPLVTVPFEGQPFLSYRDPKYFRDNLSKYSDAVAVQAWQRLCVVSASGREIPIFHPEQSEYLRSIIALPIIVDEDIQKSFSEKGIMLDSVIGVICIDCDNEEILSKKNQCLNDLIIQPFLNKLLFQMLFALID